MASSEDEEFEFRRRAEAEAAAPAQGIPSLLGAVAQGATSLPSHVAQAWHTATVDLPDTLASPTRRDALISALKQGVQHAGDVGAGYLQQVRDLSPPGPPQGDAPRMDTTPAQQAEAGLVNSAGINVSPASLSAALKGNLGQPNANAYDTLKTNIAEHPLGMVGAAAPFVGGAVAKGVDAAGATLGPKVAEALAKTRVPDVPAISELRAKSGALYETAKQQGVVVKPATFRSFADDLNAKLAAEGLDHDLQPKAQAVINRISGVGNEPIDLTTLDNLRKLSTNATEAAVGNPSDRRLTRLITDKIDDFVGSLKPADTLAGNPEAAGQMLGDARKLWSQQAKAQTIEDLMAKAKLSSAGTFNQDQALRTQFQKLARNQRGMSRFSPDEQAAILKVAQGSPLDQTLFGLGKLAPTNLHAIGADALMGAAGMQTGHPLLGAAPTFIGIPARALSLANTSRNAKLASALMRKP